MIHYLALGRTVLTNTPYFHAVDDLIHMSPLPRPVSGPGRQPGRAIGSKDDIFKPKLRGCDNDAGTPLGRTEVLLSTDRHGGIDLGWQLHGL
jgi:hypothetical protein